MDQLNLDIDSNILLEIAGTAALRELMDAGHLSWILLVAPNMAVVTFTTSPAKLEGLGKVVAINKDRISK